VSTPIAASGPAVEKAAGPKAAAGATQAGSGDNPFDAMLGIALAGSAANQTPPDAPAAIPTKPLEPMLLELVLEGEWTLDLATEGTEKNPAPSPTPAGSSHGAATSAGPESMSSSRTKTGSQPDQASERADPGSGERSPRVEAGAAPAITLEKGLDDWIGLVAGRDWKPVAADHKLPAHQTARKTEEAVPEPEPADPATQPLALSLSAVGVGSVAAGSVWQQQGPVADLPVPQAEPGVVPDAMPR
jgi:hypothetical protein